MKEYNVFFSYYSENNGNFEDIFLKVEAENQFQARRIAWSLFEKNDDVMFCKSIKQYGITWDANPLELQDYFNAQAASCKKNIEEIENVKIPNLTIDKEKGRIGEFERDRSYYYGALNEIDSIAKGLYKSLGMIPPSVYEEIHYTKELCTFLDLEGKYDKSMELYKRAEKAENWDNSYMFELREFFKRGYTTLLGETEIFNSQFGKDGIYPKFADIQDLEYSYLSKWNNITKKEHLSSLPMFDEKHTIPKSNHYLDYEHRILVLKKEVLKDEYQRPDQLLWCASGGGFGCSPTARGRSVFCENPITGEKYEWSRHDFHGVLRPEFERNIDFEAIKAEYQKLHPDENKAENNPTAESQEQQDFEDDLEQ